MTLPNKHITNGPGQRDLELAFIGRNLGAEAKFTIFIEPYGPIEVGLKILNLEFVTCHGQNYKLGGALQDVGSEYRKKLPPFNFIFVYYNTETRHGKMEFSNAE